jgi:hypothetical protein
LHAVKAAEIHKAMQLADVCWVALDCALGVGEGVIDGVSSVVSMFAHPIDTVQNVAVLAYELCNVLGTVGQLTCRLAANDQTAVTEIEYYCVQALSLAQTCLQKSKELSAREACRALTGFATEAWLGAKCLSSASKFFSRTSKTLYSAAKRAQEGEYALATAEGLEVRIAKESVRLFSAESSENVVRGSGALVRAVPEGWISFHEELDHLQKVVCKAKCVAPLEGKQLTFSFKHLFDYAEKKVKLLGDTFRNAVDGHSS